MYHCEVLYIATMTHTHSPDGHILVRRPNLVKHKCEEFTNAQLMEFDFIRLPPEDAEGYEMVDDEGREVICVLFLFSNYQM